ncbi:hypothetical protein BJ912DRAFT_928663 [Pholiota molesta]|nr:hypothetical protein BJ912DRAFT_928663 [Pholiota molesta]
MATKVFAQQPQAQCQQPRRDPKYRCIKDDIMQDLNNSVQCKFDDLLKHFLYCILEDNSEEKEELDKLQENIEKLQSKRYYGNASGKDANVAVDGSPSQVTGDDAGRTTENIRHETARQGENTDDSDSVNGTPEEKQLITRRDIILQDLLEKALDVVIPIANEADLLRFLKTFGFSFDKSASQRYTPYVDLCNKALDRLANAAGNLPVRKNPDELDIRFQYSDPTSIVSHPQGTTVDINRKPDVIISSRNALENAHDPTGSERSAKEPFSPDFAQRKQHLKLDWSVVLSCHEFKMLAMVVRIEEGQEYSRRYAYWNPFWFEGAIWYRISARAGGREDKKAVLGRVQCASYALQMLSYSIGVHHAINIYIPVLSSYFSLFSFANGGPRNSSDFLWLWYYDRQGIIQSTGIKIFHDFPRFLLLLLIFQRFTQEDWGIIPTLNPKAVNGHKKETPKVDSQDNGGDQNDVKNMPVIDLNNDLSDIKHVSNCWDKSIVPLSQIQLDTKEFLSPKPHCLAGRATAVVPAKSIENGKSTEWSARSTIRNFNSVMKFYFFGEVPRSTTNRIRSMVNRRWKGHRVLRIIGMKRLHKLTTVSGWPFVKAWLDGVTCHAFLWKHFVEHGDPSLNNIMYDEEKKCGVLTDFDLSLLQWEPRIPGTDRTGTVPFMAIELLSKDYWEGRIKRYYHHELESFIWILPYVFLTYINKVRKTNALIDDWRTSDYTYSRDLCYGLAGCLHTRVRRHAEDVDIFGAPAADTQPLDRRDSEDLWDKFFNSMKKNLPKEEQQEQSFHLMLPRLLHVKPSFELDDDTKIGLRESCQNILYPEKSMANKFLAIV